MHPTLADLHKIMTVPVASTWPGEPTGETFAWGSALYAGSPGPAYYSHRLLAAQMAIDCKPENFWILPTADRLPYPYAIFYSIASMFETEKELGHRADWFIWTDDDVIVPRNVISVLRKAADPVERPFVACVGYDRLPPYRPAVWEMEKYDQMEVPVQWNTAKASGVHRVYATGLCCAIFHRSLFDIVPEPWFAVHPPMVNPNGQESDIAPDNYWSDLLYRNNVPVHVTCDVEILHLGAQLPVGRKAREYIVAKEGA